MITHELDGLRSEPGDEAGLALGRLHDDADLWQRRARPGRQRAGTAFAARVLAAGPLESSARCRGDGCGASSDGGHRSP
jgi:hypothetical protein